MKNLAFTFAFAAASVLAPAASGSAEDTVWYTVQSISVRTLLSGCKIDLKADDNGKLSKIVIDHKGVVVTHDKKEFPPLEGVLLRRIELRHPRGTKADPDSYFIAIPYKREAHDEKTDENGDPYYTVNVVKLYFSGTKFGYWERCEAVKGNPGKWKLSSFHDGKIYDGGEDEGKNNPYADFDFSKGEL